MEDQDRVQGPMEHLSNTMNDCALHPSIQVWTGIELGKGLLQGSLKTRGRIPVPG